MFRTCLRSAALAVPAAFLLALLATPSSAIQRNVTIYQIQDTTSVGHVVEGSTDTVTTSGIVTGADTRPTGFGFYIQDPGGGNYSGVQIFTGGANVFADSGYARGDIIQATGRCIEFGGGTELTSASGGAFGAPPVTVKLGTAAIPTPLAVTFSNMNELAAYPVAEKFEGVLVALGGAGRTARVGGAVGLNQYLIVDSTLPVLSAFDSVRVDGQTLANPSITPPALGVVVTNVKGIAYQSARGYYIQLRDGADITQASPPVVLNAFATTNGSIRILFDRALDATTAQNAGNYSRSTFKAIDSAILVGPANQAVNLVTIVDPQVPGEAEGVTASAVKSALGVTMNPMTQPETFRAGITPITAIQTNFTVNPPFHPAPSDSSQYTFQQVTTRGVVTAVDNQTVYIQSGNTSNPSSGMIIFAPISGMTRGDDVTVSGVITEFGSASQATEYSGLDYQFENATGVAEPAAVTVQPGAVGALTGAEPYPGERYEGMKVHFDHVWVAQDSLPNGQYLVQYSNNPADTARVDDNIYHHLFAGGTGLNITGVVNDAFGQYVVVPRSASDVDSFTTVGVEPGSSAVAFALRGITPNPVSFARGTAVMHFTLPSAGKVSARVYDLAGRLVAEPAVNVAMAAGPQSLSIDGRGRSGGALGSGIFFVQLQFENKVATGKMVVTE
jgi:hypothetical protein